MPAERNVVSRVLAHRRQAVHGVVALAVVAAAVAGVALRATGYTAAVAKLSAGTVWLTNTNAGIVTLVNGTTNEPVWRVAVAQPNTTLITTELPGGALVLDPGNGTLTKVSNAKLDVAAQTTVAAGAQHLAVRDELVYLIPEQADQRISRRDPSTLEEINVLPVNGANQGLVDEHGWLWVLDDTNKRLHAAKDDKLMSTTTLDSGTGAVMALTNRGVAVIDPDGSASLVKPSSGPSPKVRRQKLSITAAQWVPTQATDDVPTGLTLLDPAAGLLGVCPTEGDCALLSLAPFGNGGDLYGTPQYQAGLVFVPDHSTGAVIIVDPATSTVRQQTKVLKAPAPFDLLVQDGKVWFNNPTTNEAGTIDPDGDVHPIKKYRDGLDGAAVAALAVGRSSPVGANEGLGSGPGGYGIGAGSPTGPVNGETTGTSPSGQDQTTPDPATGGDSTTPAVPATTPTTIAPAAAGAGAATPAPQTQPGPAETQPAKPLPNNAAGADSPSTSPAGDGQEPPGGPNNPPGGVNNPPTATNDPPASTGTNAGDPAGGNISIGPPEPPNKAVTPEDGQLLQARIALSADLAAPGEDVEFQDRSTGDPERRNWNFGDGATSTATNPKHRWDKPGTYTVTLAVTKGANTASTTQTVRVTEALTAAFNAPATARAGDTVKFTDLSTGAVKSYQWDFGDGSAPAAAQNPNHTYQGAGRYTVTLSIVGANNASSSATRTIQIALLNRPPTVGGGVVELDVAQSRTLALGDLGVVDPDGDDVALSIVDQAALPKGTVAKVVTRNRIQVDSGNTAGTGKVSFTADDGNGGSTQGTLTVTVAATVAPRLPGAPTLTVDDKRASSFSVTVHAEGVDAGTSPITDYIVRVQETGRELTSRAPTMAVDGLVVGRTYTLLAYLQTAVGRSDTPAKVVVTPIAAAVPDPPTGVRVIPNGQSVTVSWTAPANTGDSPIVEYVLSYGLNGQAPAQLRSAATNATLTLAPGSYVLGVSAVNAAGEGKAATTTYTQAVVKQPPGPPLNVTSAWCGDVTCVAWDAPDSDGGDPITGYTIRDDQSGTLFPYEGTAAHNSATGPPYVGCSKDGTGTVQWSVRANNATGSSAWTVSVHDQPGFCARPPAATAVSARFVASTGGPPTVPWNGKFEVTFSGDDARFCSGPLGNYCASPQWDVSVGDKTATFDAPGTYVFPEVPSCAATLAVRVVSRYNAVASSPVTANVTGVPPC